MSVLILLVGLAIILFAPEHNTPPFYLAGATGILIGLHLVFKDRFHRR